MNGRVHTTYGSPYRHPGTSKLTRLSRGVSGRPDVDSFGFRHENGLRSIFKFIFDWEGRVCYMLYKVVEVSPVTDEEIEKSINEWTGQGYHFEGMQFAMRESSRRPSMVFIIFTKSREKPDGKEEL